ncbi:centromere protein S-like [Tropilaelaps mercedesae]|uniref:Centromere protein S n=1 Tax=Tropilaelaps mercedesae TaxID=418985 RepID=A0A1V9XMT2_9ACAR|nr:centromere protein S-like [Tropilaelaps mercedesae]
MRPDVDEDTLVRYQVAVHYSVGNIIEGYTPETPTDAITKFDRETIAAIAQVVFRKIGILARDLEAFAKHAKRNRVTTDDVILCARRNPSLANKMREYSRKLKDEKQDKLPNRPAPKTAAAMAGPSDTGKDQPRAAVTEIIDLSKLE